LATVGFVGLGVMGGGIAKRLLDAGHTVHGYNRTRERAQWLAEAGVRLEETPRAVAEAATVVFSMVTSSPALEAVARGPDGILAGLGPGKVYVDMTTGSPAVSRALAADVAELGAQMLDAPVSGSVLSVAEGRLAIMVGGDPDAYALVEPILLELGPTVRRVGDNGQAVLLKLAINIGLQVQMVSFSEGLLLAEKAGIDKEVAVEMMLNSAGASPMLKYRGPFVLDQPTEAWFDCDMMQKDMVLALEAGRELEVPLPMAAASNEVLSSARAMGLGSRDFAIVYDVLARMAGLERAVS